MLYRNLFSCLSGNIVEWFEFAIYGYLASLMSNLFFPHEEPTIALLNTYVVFAIGFVMRPIGGAFFGYIGDKYGRKKALCWSILLMSLPTGLIGLLPTYYQIGILATYALLLLRLLQGFSAGGELTSSFVFISEHAPVDRRGFYASFTMLTALLGVWLGSFIGAIILNLSTIDVYAQWIWRVPFIMAAIIGLIGLYIRSKATETDVFKTQRDLVRHISMSRDDYIQVIHILLTTLSCAVSFYLLFVYLPTYLSQYTDITAEKSAWINSFNLLLMIAMIPLFGYLSDLYGRKTVMLLGNFGLIMMACPLYSGFIYSSDWVMLIQFILGIFVASIFAPMPAMITELVAAKNRCRAVSTGFNLSIALFGGTAPMCVIYVIHYTDILLTPSFYIMLSASISAIAIYVNQETKTTSFVIEP